MNMPENEGFGKFRKKPVVIRAKLMGEPFDVETLEGKMHGNAGDWLAIGVDGERYPIKGGIFRKTYVPANEICICPVLGMLLSFWIALLCALIWFQPSIYYNYLLVSSGLYLIIFQLLMWLRYER
jgi:hypothetical protein